MGGNSGECFLQSGTVLHQTGSTWSRFCSYVSTTFDLAFPLWLRQLASCIVTSFGLTDVYDIFKLDEALRVLAFISLFEVLAPLCGGGL